jgi:hypothetical protein
MKLTKQMLKQIIKEELNEVGKYGDDWLGGSTRSVPEPHTAALEALATYIRTQSRYSTDQELLDLLQTAEEAIVDFENPLSSEDY